MNNPKINFGKLIESFEKSQCNYRSFPYHVGDTLSVNIKSLIKNRKDTIMTGQLIAVKGSYLNKSFTLRYCKGTVAYTRQFMLNSPLVLHIDLVKKGSFHKAKLYFASKANKYDNAKKLT